MSRHRACLNRASAKGKAPRGPRGKVSGKPREVPLLQAPAACPALPSRPAAGGESCTGGSCCSSAQPHHLSQQKTRCCHCPRAGAAGWVGIAQTQHSLKFSPSRPGVHTASWAQAHHYWIQASTLSTKTTPLAQGTGQFLCTACETVVHRWRVSCWDCQGAPGHLGGWWVIAGPPCQTQLWGSAVTVAGSGPSPAPQFPHLKIRDK